MICHQFTGVLPPYLPRRVPVFGHIFANLFDPANPHLGLTALRQEHGDIFMMQVCGRGRESDHPEK